MMLLSHLHFSLLWSSSTFPFQSNHHNQLTASRNSTRHKEMKKRLYLPFRKQETNPFSGSNQIQLLASRSIFGNKINNSQIYSDAHQDIFKTTLNFTKESEQIKKGLGLGFFSPSRGGAGVSVAEGGRSSSIGSSSLLQSSGSPPSTWAGGWRALFSGRNSSIETTDCLAVEVCWWERFIGSFYPQGRRLEIRGLVVCFLASTDCG